MTLPNWYGIEGIGFQFNGPWNDPHVILDGKADNAGVDAEYTMWERFTEEFPEDKHGEGFTEYMRDNADEVEFLIRLARGDI